MNKTIANIISVIFHPLTITTYIMIVLLMLNPFLFGKNSIEQGGGLIAQVFFTTFCLPALAVAMMKGLGLIDSFQMVDKKERIIPYITTAMFYLWIFMTTHKNPNIPVVFVSAMLGTIISIFISFFINNFSKISAHAVGVGGLIGIVAITLRWFAYSYFHLNIQGQKIEIAAFLVFIAVIIIGGLVCSARLWLNAHSMKDIVGGFIVGVFGQWAAITYLL
jgi:membrane-associated phospholipid phosphatase